MGSINIEILNWEQYNPRGDSKKPSWFRMQNNFFFSTSTYDLTNDQKIVLIFLFSIASQKNLGSITLSIDYITRFTSVNTCDISNALEILKQKQILNYYPCESRTDPCESRTKSPTTNERTNERTQSSTGFANAPPRGCILELSGISTTEELLSTTSHKLQLCWLEAYPSPDWIKAELQKSSVWLLANPKRKSKNFGRFMSNWLNRAFENYRKTIPTNKPGSIQFDVESKL